jgi:ankyrin repeat protein
MPFLASLVAVGCFEPPQAAAAAVPAPISLPAELPKIPAPAKPTAAQLAANARAERAAKRKAKREAAAAALEAKRAAREGAHTKLIQGIIDCEPSTVRQAIADGADVNAPNEDGDHPLFLAAYRGDRNVIEPLVEAGSRINGKSHDGWTPLDSALHEGHAALAQYLMDRGGQIGARGDQGLEQVPYDGDDHWNNPNELASQVKPSAARGTLNESAEQNEPNMFVVLGSWPVGKSTGAAKLQRRASELSMDTEIAESDAFPNFRRGLTAVVSGPWNKAEAMKRLALAKKLVRDAYVKSGW